MARIAATTTSDAVTDKLGNTSPRPRRSAASMTNGAAAATITIHTTDAIQNRFICPGGWLSARRQSSAVGVSTLLGGEMPARQRS